MSPDTFHRRGDADTPLPLSGLALERIVDVVQFLGFWTAVALPVVYLPMIALGLATSHPFGFIGLLGLNAVALVVGHGHERDA